MILIRVLKAGRRESGQMLIMFALLLPLLFCFVGFGIDFGIAFVTKAQLAKAADAAALTAMLTLGHGQAEATRLGQAKFALNYNASSKLNVSPPNANISYTTDSNGDPVVNVKDTAQIKTFFIGFAGFPTLTISNYAQATRPPIILSLVLDKSGSMGPMYDDGGAYLPGAVTDFLGYFMEGTDRLAEVSFSSVANTDVPITTTFKTPITNSVDGMKFAGATFAYGGLSNGRAQVTSVSPLPPRAEQAVVFFTDGWANTVQDHLPAPGGPLLNFGGCSPPEALIGWCGGFFCMNSTDGSYFSPASNQNAGICNGVTTFIPSDPTLANPSPLNIATVSQDAKYRTIQLANSMRAAGITVYTIGMGNEVDDTYLMKVANANPSVSGIANPDYNPSEPTGLYEKTSATDLEAAFDDVAAKIILRLTH